MKLLFIGDIFGKPGRTLTREGIPWLVARHKIDLVIANVENAAGGNGITKEIGEAFRDHGIDVMTSGNHIWDKREALDLIQDEVRLLRPHNYPEKTPGSGWAVVTGSNGVEVGVLNIMGTVFMHPTLDCPFRCVDDVLTRKPETLKVILVDFHAEATSEKVAMGWYLDGRVSGVVGLSLIHISEPTRP